GSVSDPEHSPRRGCGSWRSRSRRGSPAPTRSASAPSKNPRRCDVAVGPYAPTDPVAAFAGRIAGLDARIRALELAASRPGSIIGGTYAPTLGVIGVGTGGSAANTARWRLVRIGQLGELHLAGIIRFGTSGATFPGGGAETVSFPSG